MAVGVIMAAAALFQGLMNSKSAADQENRVAAAKNKAAMKFNEQVMQQAATETSQVNMQRAQSIRATTAALFNIKAQEQAAADEANMYSATNDNIGASTKVAAQAVAMQSDRSQADTMIQLDYQNEGFNMMLRNISEGVGRSIKDAYESQASTIMRNGIFGAIGDGVMAYAKAGGGTGNTPKGDGAPVSTITSPTQRAIDPSNSLSATTNKINTGSSYGSYWSDNRGQYRIR